MGEVGFIGRNVVEADFPGFVSRLYECVVHPVKVFHRRVYGEVFLVVPGSDAVRQLHLADMD